MPFKGCLSDACVLMKIERFVLKPLRKIERFVLKQHTFRFADYTLAEMPCITMNRVAWGGAVKIISAFPFFIFMSGCQ